MFLAAQKTKKIKMFESKTDCNSSLKEGPIQETGGAAPGFI
jgi:hypothetical protein